MKFDKVTLSGRLKNFCSEFERRLVYRTVLVDTVKYRGGPTFNTLRLLKDLRDDKLTCLCDHCVNINAKIIEELQCLQKSSGYIDNDNSLPSGKTSNIQMWVICCNFFS